MAFTGSAPSTNILNGNAALGATFVGGSAAVPKATTKKTTKKTTVQNPVYHLTPTDAHKYDQFKTPSTTRAVQANTPLLPPELSMSNQHYNPWTTIGLPLIIALSLITLFMWLGYKLTEGRVPAVGYAHRHKRVGGPSHNTPGKMRPRIFKH